MDTLFAFGLAGVYTVWILSLKHEVVRLRKGPFTSEGDPSLHLPDPDVETVSHSESASARVHHPQHAMGAPGVTSRKTSANGIPTWTIE